MKSMETEPPTDLDPSKTAPAAHSAQLRSQINQETLESTATSEKERSLSKGK